MVILFSQYIEIVVGVLFGYEADARSVWNLVVRQRVDFFEIALQLGRHVLILDDESAVRPRLPFCQPAKTRVLLNT